MDHLYSSIIKRLEPDTLKQWITEQRKDVVIVDVRDSDYKIAKLPTSIHIPSTKFSPELALNHIATSNNKSDSNTTVQPTIPKDLSKFTFIFHCMRSQQRGPSCSRKFLRYLLLKTECKNDLGKLPKIYVLDGGLKKWNQLYGNDLNLLIPL